MRVQPALQENLRGGLVDDFLLLPGVAAGLPKGALRRHGRQPLIPGNHRALDPAAELPDQSPCLLRRGSEGAIHVPRHADHDRADLTLVHDLDNPRDRVPAFDGFERMSEQPEIVTYRHTRPDVAGINSQNSLDFHFELKIPHHKPTLRNMSSISLEKFGDNLPVTGIMALSQAAIGFGVGLLLAGRMDESSRNRTAIALISAGAATIVPFVVGIVSNASNRPDSSRRLRQQLDSIRGNSGLPGAEDVY